MADRQRSTEPCVLCASSATAASSGLGACSVSGPCVRLSINVLRIGFALEVVSGIRAIERFVADRKIGDDVALDCGFQQRPLGKRRGAGGGGSPAPPPPPPH